MNVNRSRFLLLTAALAAGTGGCTVNEINAGDGGTQDASSGGDSSTSDSATGDAAADSSTGDDGSTCDDTVGTVPDCAALADAGAPGDGGTSCSTYAAFASACSKWAANLKPRVAKRAIDCAVALPSCESGAGLNTCLSGALQAACADTSAQSTCMTIASICTDAGADAGASPIDCAQALAGMNAGGRQAVQTCFTEGSCSMDLGACIDAKFF